MISSLVCRGSDLWGSMIIFLSFCSIGKDLFQREPESAKGQSFSCRFIIAGVDSSFSRTSLPILAAAPRWVISNILLIILIFLSLISMLLSCNTIAGAISCHTAPLFHSNSRMLSWWRMMGMYMSVSYTHLRAHETRHDLVCR